MPKESNRRRSLWRRVTLIVVIAILFGFIYRAAYYGTTSLSVGTPQLDWYAHREFSSRAHFIFFFPMFYWESRYDRSNPGYTLQPEFSTKP
jgi:hypothetical protein